MFCSQCGTQNKDGGKFCKNCGHPFGKVESDKIDSAKEIKKSKKKKVLGKKIKINTILMIKLIVVVLILASLGFGGHYLYGLLTMEKLLTFTTPDGLHVKYPDWEREDDEAEKELGNSDSLGLALIKSDDATLMVFKDNDDIEDLIENYKILFELEPEKNRQILSISKNKGCIFEFITKDSRIMNEAILSRLSVGPRGLRMINQGFVKNEEIFILAFIVVEDKWPEYEKIVRRVIMSMEIDGINVSKYLNSNK